MMKRIGMVIGTETKPCRDVVLGIVDQVRSNPELRLRFFHASQATSSDNIAAFASTGVDGVVFCGLPRDVFDRFLAICPDHVPLVLCLYTLPNESDFQNLGWGGAVVINNESIGRRAADFFLDRGLRNFAFLSSFTRREFISGVQRRAAFEKRVRAALGTTLSYAHWTMGSQMPNGDYWDPDEGEMERWVSSLALPCGVFVNGDREALALTRVCGRLGLEVPEKLEILSINNAHGFCERAQPALSSLEPDYRQCAGTAVKMLLELMDDPSLPRGRRLVRISACQLVERGSTSVGRNRGRLVTRAREFIRLHACDGIGVPDVVAALGVSRRLLEKVLREATGQSPLQLIQETRLESCRHLLETTRLSVTEVLKRSGYPLTASPPRLFRKTFGMTMTAYRAAHRTAES